MEIVLSILINSGEDIGVVGVSGPDSGDSDIQYSFFYKIENIQLKCMINIDLVLGENS